MKKTMRFLSMAALALVGIMMTGCSSDDDFQQPETKGNVVTLTTTVSLDGGATTRALTSGGVKTFAVGETMAIIYKNMSGTTIKAVTEALTADDITNEGKSATFTVTLTDPDKTKDVTYIYPAAMAKDDGSVNYAALNVQDGTLATLGSTFDLGTKSGAWSQGNLPTLTLNNELAILAINLKDGESDVTSDINTMTITDGTNVYSVNRSAAAGPIYVAIRPTSGASIYAMATAITTNYSKSLTDKTYAANNGYNVSWKMTNEGTVSLATPLSMKAITSGTIVVKYPKDDMKYSTDGGTSKTPMTTGVETTINVNAGDVVTFYGSSTGYNKDEITGGTAYVKAYGNIMSLFYESDFASMTTLPGTSDQQLLGFFRNNSKLIDASGMLLPATELKNSCYSSMFAGCTALIGAPVLPATTLATYCYYTMFSGCNSLVSVTCLATDISATGCTTAWLTNAGTNVLTTKTFTKASGMNSWTTGANGIPSGWTVK